MDLTQIFVRSFALAVLLGILSVYLASRIRAGHAVSSRRRFALGFVVNSLGFGLVLLGLIPLWAVVPMALIMGLGGGAIVAKFPSAESIALLDASRRSNR